MTWCIATDSARPSVFIRFGDHSSRADLPAVPLFCAEQQMVDMVERILAESASVLSSVSGSETEADAPSKHVRLPPFCCQHLLGFCYSCLRYGDNEMAAVTRTGLCPIDQRGAFACGRGKTPKC